MYKTLLVSLLLTAATFVAPVSVLAEDPLCVTQYGGAVVCGAATPQFHAPVKTGIADFSFKTVGFAFVITSAVLYLKSRKSVVR